MKKLTEFLICLLGKCNPVLGITLIAIRVAFACFEFFEIFLFYFAQICIWGHDRREAEILFCKREELRLMLKLEATKTYRAKLEQKI